MKKIKTDSIFQEIVGENVTLKDASNTIKYIVDE